MINNLIEKISNEFIQLDQDNKKYRIQQFKASPDNAEEKEILNNIFFLFNNHKDYFVLKKIGYSDLNKQSIDKLQRQIHSYSRVNFENQGLSLPPNFERNKTLILFVRIDAVGYSPQIIKQIINIEEDPFLFKKQIIVLTSNEYKIIEELSNENSILRKFKTIIQNVDEFNKFKTELKENVIDKSAIYSLVAKLYEKFPFLQFDIVEESYKNLEEIIESALELKCLSALKSQILLSDFELTKYVETYLQMENSEND